MPLESGRLLGQYEIIGLLGSGGMGEVYRAHDRKLGRDVALKVIRPQISDSHNAVTRFRREIRAMLSLNHPAIVTVFDVGEVDPADGTTFIAMELIEGESFRSWLSRPRERSLIVDLLAFVSEGLASAHARGVVHRDIKPENIMVLRDGYAKIVDFGLAKLMEGDSSHIGADPTSAMATAAGQIVGTLAYMSPEQLNGEEVDRRSDIFSFGCVLSEALAGRHPFAAPTRAAMLHRLTSGRFDALPIVGGDAVAVSLNAIIARCLAPGRDERYQTMLEVANDLKKVSRTSSEAATVVRPAGRTGRSRLLGWVAIAAVAAIVSSGVFLFWRQESARPASHSALLAPELNEMFNRAEFLERDRDGAVKDRAIPLLEAIVKRQPSFVPAHVELAGQYSRKAFVRDADRSWEEQAALEVAKVLALDPKNASAYAMRGSLIWSAAHAYNHEEAIASYNRALALDPNHLEALRGRSSVYLHIGLLDSARRDLTRVLRSSPDDDFSHYRVARISLYEGKYDEAIAEYRRHFPSAFELAIALSHAGRADEALDLATRLIRDPQEDNWSAYAVVAAKGGDRKGALEAIRHAIELGEGSSHFHHAMYNVAVAYAQLGEPNEAMRWLDRTADEGLPCAPLFEHDPFLDPLRKVPRFAIFLRERQAETERLRRIAEH